MLIGPERRRLVFCIPLGPSGPPTMRAEPRNYVGCSEAHLPDVRMLAVIVSHGM